MDEDDEASQIDAAKPHGVFALSKDMEPDEDGRYDPEDFLFLPPGEDPSEDAVQVGTWTPVDPAAEWPPAPIEEEYEEELVTASEDEYEEFTEEEVLEEEVTDDDEEWEELEQTTTDTQLMRRVTQLSPKRRMMSAGKKLPAATAAKLKKSLPQQESPKEPTRSMSGWQNPFDYQPKGKK